jgi:hypothetical protein
MLLASIRLGFFVASLVASLHVAAAPRFWTLSGVQFADGAVATGYFSYDDATRTVADWNLRVSGGAGPFIPWTFVPGNSHAEFSFQTLYVYSYSPSLVPGFWGRSFVIRLFGPLDGSSTTIPINVSSGPPTTLIPEGSNEFFENEYDGGNPSLRVAQSRKVIAGSLMLTPLPPPVTIVQVDEFYHPGLRHYFITADAVEKERLDTGVYPGWERTGESFKAYAAGSRPDGPISPVCRYYRNPLRGLDSHFYSASGYSDDTLECESVSVTFPSEWLLESDNVFQINLPDTATGTCPAGTIPVYRLWDQRGDSNHRYTASAAMKMQMLAAGYVSEGYGPDGVVMCAVQ